MKIICLQENLSKGINTVSRLVSSKTQLPILSNILLKTEEGRLKITATNLETGINLWIGAKIEKEGSFTIPAKILSEFVNSLPKDKVTLELKGNLLNISCQSFSADINGLPASEFPEVPSLDGKISFVLEPEVLKRAINCVGFAAATDEGRPVLTGVLFNFKKEKIEIVATDGYRLSIKTIDNKNKKEEVFKEKIIVPARTMMEVARIIQEGTKEEKEKVQISLTKEGGQIIFHYQDTDLITRLIEGQFPAYEKIIPQENTTKIIVSTPELIQAVRVASIFARESANIVKFKIQSINGGPKLKIMANAPQLGRNITELDIKKEGEDNKIAFNSRYLMDLLTNIGSEELIFEMGGSLNPGVFKPVGDDSYLHIIMPVRVQEEE